MKNYYIQIKFEKGCRYLVQQEPGVWKEFEKTIGAADVWLDGEPEDGHWLVINEKDSTIFKKKLHEHVAESFFHGKYILLYHPLFPHWQKRPAAGSLAKTYKAVINNIKFQYNKKEYVSFDEDYNSEFEHWSFHPRADLNASYSFDIKDTTIEPLSLLQKEARTELRKLRKHAALFFKEPVEKKRVIFVEDYNNYLFNLVKISLWEFAGIKKKTFNTFRKTSFSELFNGLSFEYEPQEKETARSQETPIEEANPSVLNVETVPTQEAQNQPVADIVDVAAVQTPKRRLSYWKPAVFLMVFAGLIGIVMIIAIGIQSKPKVRVTKGSRLYSAPSFDSAVIEVLPRDARLTPGNDTFKKRFDYQDCKFGEWCNVLREGRNAYVFGTKDSPPKYLGQLIKKQVLKIDSTTEVELFVHNNNMVARFEDTVFLGRYSVNSRRVNTVLTNSNLDSHAIQIEGEFVRDSFQSATITSRAYHIDETVIMSKPELASVKSTTESPNKQESTTSNPETLSWVQNNTQRTRTNTVKKTTSPDEIENIQFSQHCLDLQNQFMALWLKYRDHDIGDRPNRVTDSILCSSIYNQINVDCPELGERIKWPLN